MILVDMEMPKSCRFCHLQDVCVPFQREVVTEVVSIDTLNERHKDCPIKSEIPEGATNGDVIKALFPDCALTCNIMGEEFICEFNGNKKKSIADREWWDEPYKRGDEDANSD